MLQRIQTVYLLLALICVALIYAFPFAKITVTNDYIFSTAETLVDGKNVSPLPFSLLTAVLIGITLASVLLFKNRPLQLRIGRLNYLLHLGYLVAVYFSVDSIQSKIPNGSVAVVAYGIGFYLPVAAIAFIFLANRSIKKDEELIKSIDRLRN